MRDRICRIEENLLQRTAGPYIRVKAERLVVNITAPLCPRKPTSRIYDGSIAFDRQRRKSTICVAFFAERKLLVCHL